MKRLTVEKYWDSYWDSENNLNGVKERKGSSEKKIKILIKNLLGKKLIDYAYDYSEYYLWNVIYKKYLPRKKEAKVLEIGSAPGYHLVKLNKRFGFEPYGVEYSKSGVYLNKEVFISNDINPNNVIHADFFSDEFHKQYKGCFDIVISKGFLEHFTNVQEVIEKHINLLKKGGCLIVGIPNFRGVNYALLWFFNREMISMHNIDIMNKQNFSRSFDKKYISPSFCGYFGIFNFSLFGTKNNLKRFVLIFFNSFQLILNVIFRILFKDKRIENKLFSPYLMFCGMKKD